MGRLGNKKMFLKGKAGKGKHTSKGRLLIRETDRKGDDKDGRY